jgi:hypothetical protein
MRLKRWNYYYDYILAHFLPRFSGFCEICGLIQAWDWAAFNTARRTLRDYEPMNMIRKGQIKGVAKGDIRSQAEYARTKIFGVAA